MTLKEIFIVAVLTPLLIIALIGGLWLLLVYYDDIFGEGTGTPSRVECKEEEGGGICGVWRFFTHGSDKLRYNVEADINL